MRCVLSPVNHTDKRAVLMHLREKIRKLDVRGTDFNLIKQQEANKFFLARTRDVDPSICFKGALLTEGRLDASKWNTRMTTDLDIGVKDAVEALKKVIDAACAPREDDVFRFRRGDYEDGEGKFNVKIELILDITWETIKIDIAQTPYVGVRGYELFDLGTDLFGKELGSIRAQQIHYQLANKLDAYFKWFGDDEDIRHSRFLDFTDMVLLVDSLTPNDVTAKMVRLAIDDVWSTEPKPNVFRRPPDSWEDELPARTKSSKMNVSDEYDRLASFWNPVLSNKVKDSATWNGSSWTS